MNSIKNRYEITALIEAKMCNPNGDPDLDNLPRNDMETGYGFITDVAIKSRIRAYVMDAYAEKEGLEILIKDGNSINRSIAESVLKVNSANKIAKHNKENEAAQHMCERYWDVRTFGGVLSTGLKAGQVRGPVQISMPLSVDPIDIEEIAITRKAYTEGKFSTLEEYDAADDKKELSSKRTMGKKSYIPYGLYVLKITVSANVAAKVNFTEDDLNILLEGIAQMYNCDASSSKMGMSVVSPIVIFKHIGTQSDKDSEQNIKEAMFGCTHSYKLFDLLKIEKKEDVIIPRNYSDYNVTLKLEDLPAGVICGLKDNPYGGIVWQTDNKNINLQ